MEINVYWTEKDEKILYKISIESNPSVDLTMDIESMKELCRKLDNVLKNSGLWIARAHEETGCLQINTTDDDVSVT